MLAPSKTQANDRWHQHCAGCMMTMLPLQLLTKMSTEKMPSHAHIEREEHESANTITNHET
jgi:hypothetical protein